MIFCLMADSKNSWVDALPRIELTLRGVLRDENEITPYQYIFGKQMKFGRGMKEDNLVNENFIEKILQKDPHQGGQQKIKVGSFVMIRLFPIEKSIFKPRFDGQFKVIDVKGQNKCITVIGREGEKIVRNIQDTKKVEAEVELPIKKRTIYRQVSKYSSSSSASIHNSPTPRYPQRRRRQNVRYGFSPLEEEG